MRGRCGLGALAASLLLALPAAAGASVTTWGSSLSATPNADTANEAYTSDPSVHGPDAVLPDPHDAQDTSVFNTAVAGGTATAPTPGQVLSVSVKGCAHEDTTAPPSQQSSNGAGGFEPVNAIEFIVEAPNGSGGWSNQAVAGTYTLPFCNPLGGTPNTSTVSTFTPLHMCIAAGQAVALHDLGGYIPQGTQGGTGLGPWYPQGIPLEVISQPLRAAPTSSATASYVGQAGSFGPPVAAPPATSGYATEAGQELMMQISEGSGEDAYGLCPGGRAVESNTSNSVICVSGGPSTEGHGVCDGNGNPTYPPVNQTPPKISGTPQIGYALILTRGTWTNNPGKYVDQWQRCDGFGANCADIPGAVNLTYHPVTADVGRRIRVEETVANVAGQAGPVASAPSAAILASTTTGGGGGSTGGGGGGSGTPGVKPVLHHLQINLHSGGKIVVHYVDSESGTTTTLTVFTIGRHPRRVKVSVHHDRAGVKETQVVNGLKPGRYTVQLVAAVHGLKSAALSGRLTVPKPRHR